MYMHIDKVTVKNSQISLSAWPWTIVHGHQKFNRSELAQNIFASRDWCHMHAHQFCCVFFGFGDIATFKNGKFPLLSMDYIPWSSKNLIDRNRLKKFNWSESAQKIHASSGWCQVHAHQFWWAWNLRFRRYRYFQKQRNFPFWAYTPWSSKNLIHRNRLKIFMQVGPDVKCMHTNFGGHGLSGFRDIATFKNGQISLSEHGLL